MTDYLTTHGLPLLRSGYPIVPIKPGTKSPGLKDWTTLKPTEDQISSWATNGYAGGGVGILAERYPGIDLDIRDESIARQITDVAQLILGPAPVRTGNAPKALLAYRTDHPFTKLSSSRWRDPGTGIEHQVEVLGTGQQWIAYGDHAETGHPYTWDTELVDFGELSAITRDEAVAFLQQVETLVPEHWEIVSPGDTGAAHGDVDALDEIKRPLDIDNQTVKTTLVQLDPAMSYPDWIRVGMALHHQFGGADYGLRLWDIWSSHGGSKYQEGACEKHWLSFKERQDGKRPVTFALPMKWAKEGTHKRRQRLRATQLGDQAGATPPAAPASPTVTPSERTRLTLTDLRAHMGNLIVTEDDVSQIGEEEWLVENLIIKGHLLTLVGEPNAGKTALMTWLCPQLVQQGQQVIYCNLDAPASSIKRQYAHASEHGYLLVAPDLKEGMNSDSVVSALEGLKAAHTLDDIVIVFDTLKKFAAVIQKGEVREFFLFMRELTARGATCIALGHTNKYRDTEGNLRFEGTGDVRSDSDELIFLEYLKDSGQRRQIITTYPEHPGKTRGDFSQVSWELNLDDWSMKVLPEVMDVKTDRIISSIGKEKIKRNDPNNAIRICIREAIDDGWKTQAEIVQYCVNKGHGRDRARRTLKMSSDPVQGVQWLEAVQIPGKDNRIEYRLLDEEPVGDQTPGDNQPSCDDQPTDES